MTSSITVLINGSTRDLTDGTTVDEMLTEVFSRKSGCAVARNGEIVPKSEWSDTKLSAGDSLEILGAAQGG